MGHIFMLPLVFIYLLIGCTEKKLAKPDSNSFNIIYQSDVDRIDLHNGYLERKSVNGVKRYKFLISEEDRSGLAKFITDKKIGSVSLMELAMPCPDIITPLIRYTLNIQMQNQPAILVEWDSNNCSTRLRDLEELQSRLYEIVYRSHPVIEPTDITFE